MSHHSRINVCNCYLNTPFISRLLFSGKHDGRFGCYLSSDFVFGERGTQVSGDNSKVTALTRHASCILIACISLRVFISLQQSIYDPVTPTHTHSHTHTPPAFIFWTTDSSPSQKAISPALRHNELFINPNYLVSFMQRVSHKAYIKH